MPRPLAVKILFDVRLNPFEESLAPFSSPTSEKNQLPDTIPLVSTEQDNQSCTPMKKVDFSETASTVHRSPSFEGANEAKDIWNFDDSPSDSSPVPRVWSGMRRLMTHRGGRRYIDAEAPCCRDPPDVRPNPFVSAEQDDQSFTPMKAVDFSETASTIHRSSSLLGANEPKDIWNFDDSPTESSPIPETSKEMPTIPSDHSPSDELYDFIPKKATAQTQAPANPNSS
ncbi:hypothetical protein N5P37_002996 [Trichoderma harzianum]|nr:hypothetical protein N5P37_002996 [Trichoderma harzianum]